MVSRAENIQKSKDQAHRLKGVLQDSIMMLEQVGTSVYHGTWYSSSVSHLLLWLWENIYYIIWRIPPPTQPPRGIFPCQFL